MFFRSIIVLFLAVFLSITIRNTNAFRPENDQTRMNGFYRNIRSIDQDFSEQLRALATALEEANGKNDQEDTTSIEHLRNTRLTVNRRPGLLRLRKK